MGQAGPGGNSRPRDFDGLPGGRGPGVFKCLPPWAGAPEVFLSLQGGGGWDRSRAIPVNDWISTQDPRTGQKWRGAFKWFLPPPGGLKGLPV